MTTNELDAAALERLRAMYDEMLPIRDWPYVEKTAERKLFLSIFDILPQLLALAEDGLRWREEQDDANYQVDIGQLGELTRDVQKLRIARGWRFDLSPLQYAYLKARMQDAETPELDDEDFGILVAAGYVYRDDDDMVGVSPAGRAAVAEYERAAGSGAEGGSDE